MEEEAQEKNPLLNDDEGYNIAPLKPPPTSGLEDEQQQLLDDLYAEDDEWMDGLNR